MLNFMKFRFGIEQFSLRWLLAGVIVGSVNVGIAANIGIATSREGIASAREGIATSREGMATAKEGIATAREGIAAQREGIDLAECCGGELTARELSGNLMAYPYVDEEPPAQTAPPEGYVPFHMEHYSRHGSRWLIGGDDYLTPVRRLEAAERNGKLTPLGEKTLAVLRDIQKESEGRLGELSDNGALQHRAIGRRMARNFPEIFNADADIDAKATVVIRCILSMYNGINGIQDIVPEVMPKMDASHADMWFMNFDDKDGWKEKTQADTTVLADFKKRHEDSGEYLDRLVTDPQFARDSVAPGILPYLYWVLANTQSHSTQPWILEEVFSKEELKENWLQGNAGWFLHGGNTALTNGRPPYVQRKLLGRIIEQTDSAIAGEKPSARLRYGHDGILLNLISLMEIGGYGDRIDSLEELEEKGWHDHDIIPMGGNLQLVFYRKPGGAKDDVLVKAMINEREMTLPGEPVSGCYYRWSDLRRYYLDKLDAFERR